MTGAAAADTPAAIESSVRPPLLPTSDTSKPDSRLVLFRRQLAAAFGPTERRQSRLRVSLRFHRSEPQDDKLAEGQAGGLRARSLESRHERFVSPVHTRRLLKMPPTSLFCATTAHDNRGCDRKTRSPRHLIRMFAERREDSLLETRQNGPGCQNIVGHLFDAASQSASKFVAAKTLDSTTATTLEHNSANRFAQMTPKLSLPIDHECTLNYRGARTAKICNRAAGFSQVARQSGSSEQLLKMLDELERERGAARINLEFNTDLELVHERTRQVSRRWAESDNLRLQQEAILELLGTELNYIQRLGVVSELFLGTLEQVQARSRGAFLVDIEPEPIASNVKQILDAHRALWLRHLRSLIESPNRLLEPSELSGAFSSICRTFAPYYCFCTQQASCIVRIKSLCAESESFRAFLGWCESRPECNRMRLVDLLALPMQRLTRYPLLLRTILKRTDNGVNHEQECEALVQMIALTDKFVHTVDLEMKRRDDFTKLCDISDRLVAVQAAATSAASSHDHNNHDYNYHNQEVRAILRSYLGNFNSQTLMLSLFECPFACHRQLLFDSSAFKMPIKFKDAQNTSRLDVIILILTDQLLVCKQLQHHRQSRWHPTGAAGANTSDNKSIFHHQHQLQSHYASSSANSDQLQVPSSFEQAPATTDNAPRPLFMRQRAASHSFERRLPSDVTGGGGRLGDDHQQQQRRNIATADDLNFLSPARALIKMSSEQTLVWAGDTSGGCRAAGARRRSTSNCGTPTLLTSPNIGHHHHHIQHHQSRSVSNCSLVSNSNFELSWPASGPASEINPLVTPPVSPQRHLQRQSNSLTGQPANCNSRESTRRGEKPPVKLRLVQSPYPIERLITHELSDRRSVLICQMNNETQTVANSFVLLFPKQTCSHASSSSPRMSPARRLIVSLEEAQKRHLSLAQLHGGLHGKQFKTFSTCRYNQIRNQQPSCSSIESSPARHNSQIQVDHEPLRLAQLVAEQHELFMLSHGRHEELATNEFTYELARDQVCEFRVVARPLGRAPTTCSPSHSTRSQWPPPPPLSSVSPLTQHQHRLRPQLGRSTRVLNEQQSADARSANSVSPSLESDGEYLNDTSRFNNLLAFGRSNDSERDVKSICSQSISMSVSEAPDRQPGSTRSAGVSRQASQRTNASSRKNLSFLRRQNVVLSVSCEQQQPPEPTRVINQDSLDRRLLHTQFVAAETQQQRRLPRNYDSSSIDSTAGGPATSTHTDNSFRRNSRKSLVSRRYGSSSVQTTTIDQTFDEATLDLAGEQEDELSRLLAVRGREMSQNLSRLQSIRSVSTDQTSSPIAVTLTVPIWCEPEKMDEQLVADKRVPSQPGDTRCQSTDDHADERNEAGLLTGCLDMKSLKASRERQRKLTCGSSPSSGGKVRSRMSAIINHLHLRH